MMKNKKAWLRIVEAFIAVLIVLGAVLVIMSKQQVQEDLSDEIYEIQFKILDVISKNYTLRDYVVNGNELVNGETKKDKLKKMIRLMLPSTFDFVIEICDIENVCSADFPNDKSVHTREVLITTNLKKYAPKKLRFFVWIKD